MFICTGTIDYFIFNLIFRIVGYLWIIQNHDLKSRDSGIKFNISKKWAKSIILLSWAFAYDIWTERNIIEHDSLGCPETQKKEKIIEHIQDKFT
jgi:hypothetical protein